jgi:hypothetical protein
LIALHTGMIGMLDAMHAWYHSVAVSVQHMSLCSWQHGGPGAGRLRCLLVQSSTTAAQSGHRVESVLRLAHHVDRMWPPNHLRVTVEGALERTGAAVLWAEVHGRAGRSTPGCGGANA